MRRQKTTRTHGSGAASRKAGFSLIELMVAMTVLLIGLIGAATVIMGGLALSLQSKDLAVANQLAKEGMEAVFTARILNNITFAQLDNVENGAGGIFYRTYDPIRLLGSDGLINTAAYRSQPLLQYIDPGKNGIYETPAVSGVPYATTVSPGSPSGDDKIITFDRFQRQIVITSDPNNPTVRQVTINVQVTNNGITSLATSLTTLIGAN